MKTLLFALGAVVCLAAETKTTVEVDMRPHLVIRCGDDWPLSGVVFVHQSLRVNGVTKAATNAACCMPGRTARVPLIEGATAGNLPSVHVARESESLVPNYGVERKSGTARGSHAHAAAGPDETEK